MIIADHTPVTCRGEQLHEIWWQGRQWAVTAYGIEARDGTYAIAARRLAEKRGTVPDWPLHMAEKNWVDTNDFNTAFLVALALHANSAAFTTDSLRKAAALTAKLARQKLFHGSCEAM